MTTDTQLMYKNNKAIKTLNIVVGLKYQGGIFAFLVTLTQKVKVRKHLFHAANC